MHTISDALNDIQSIDHELRFLDSKYNKLLPITSAFLTDIDADTTPLGKYLTANTEFA